MKMWNLWDYSFFPTIPGYYLLLYPRGYGVENFSKLVDVDEKMF